MIIVNQVECLKCGDKPFSKHRHDFVSCKCGNISVDGGQEYLRRVGSLRDGSVKELSYSLPDDVVKACTEAVNWGKDTGRNSFGIALAVFRALKDSGYLITEEMLAGQPWLRTNDGKSE